MRFKTETKMRIQALKYRDGLENHQIAREIGISQTMIWQYIESLEKQIKKGEITVDDIVSSCNTMKIKGPTIVKAAEKEKDEIVFDEASNMTEQQVDEMIAEQGITQQELSENVKALDEALSKAGEPMNNQIKKVSPEFDITTEYMLNNLLTRDDIIKILDVCAELKNCGYTTEEILLTLNELKYFSDEIDKVGKQIGMSEEYLKDIKEPLAEFCKPAKNPSPEFTAGQLRKMLTEAARSDVTTEQMGGKAKREPQQSDYVLTIMSHIYDELSAGKLALKYYLMEAGVHELQFVEVRKK